MNYRQYNPFFPSGINPYQPPLKTPEQYQQEMLAQMTPQLDNYRAYYNQSQQQATAGQYVKVNSYDEVKTIQCPANGRPILIVDEGNNVLYSKKFENGQEFIKSFKLVENKEEKKDDTLSLILDKLNGLDNRLSTLEGKPNDVNTTNITEQTKTD